MNEQTVLELGRQTILMSALLAAPLLLVAVIVGLSITILQTVTSLQEQTLTFVTKVGAVLGVTILLLPWLIQTLCKFTTSLLVNLARYGS